MSVDRAAVGAQWKARGRVIAMLWRRGQRRSALRERASSRQL